MCRMKPMRPGNVVAVKDVPGGYPLPPGLREGSRVKLLAFQHGYWEVEFEGRRFTLYLSNLAPGMEYQAQPNVWLDENHPRIRTTRGR